MVWAALGRGIETLELLLSIGADPDAENRCGETALLHAIRRGHREAARLLLSYGADPRRRFEGKSLLELSVARAA